MEVNSICKGYREYNEDMVYVVKDHLFIVVDSATSLGESRYKPTDGVYLLQEIKSELSRLYHEHKLTGKNFIKQMNMMSKRIYSRFIKGNKDLKERYPSSEILILSPGFIRMYSYGEISLSEIGSPLQEYRNAAQNIAGSNGCMFLSQTEDTWFTQEEYDIYLLPDEVHYNETGRYHLAQELARYFK